jgi:hypothetical protein
MSSEVETFLSLSQFNRAAAKIRDSSTPLGMTSVDVCEYLRSLRVSFRSLFPSLQNW